jgi:microcystin-dependent protein
MSNPFVGEIRLFAGNFAPLGWVFCQGQLLPIAEYETLFNLIGTTYGGDGQTTFGVPDLQGRVPVHQGALAGGSTYTLGQKAGVENVTITASQMPTHSHAFAASQASGTQVGPGANLLGASSSIAMYTSQVPNVSFNPAAIGVYGGSQPHDNLQPYVCVSFIISLFGIYPSSN